MSVTEKDAATEHVVRVRRLADGNQSARCTCGFVMRRAHPRAVDLHAGAHAFKHRGRVELGAS